MIGHDYFSTIFERLPMGLFLAQPTYSCGKIIDFEVKAVNQQGASAFSLSRETILRQRISELMPSLHKRTIEWITQAEKTPSAHEYNDVVVYESDSAQSFSARLWFANETLLIIVMNDASEPFRPDSDPCGSFAKISRINEEQEILINISALLLQATPANLEEIVHMTMKASAKIATADRVYVFDYDFENRISNNLYEWCAGGIIPQIDSLQNVPFANIQEWLSLHEKGQTVIVPDLAALADDSLVKEALEPQDIKSVIAVPLFFEDELFGFIGFDSVRQKHDYTPKEEHILQQYGNNLLATLMRIKFEQALRESEERYRIERELYRTTLLSIGDAVASTDTKGNIVFANRVFEQLTEHVLHEIQGVPLQGIFRLVNEESEAEQECQIQYVLETGCAIAQSDQVAMVSKSGRIRSVEYTISPVMDAGGRTQGAVLAFRDVTEKRTALKRIEYLSAHDALTGLLNRHSFTEEIKKTYTKDNLPLSLLVIDVNGLKLTNDAFGHVTGDLLIKRVAEILTRACFPQNLIFRLGGDEFIALLPNTDFNLAQDVKNRIVQLSSSESIGNVIISVAVGCYTVDDADCDILSVMKEAESDMYREKIISGRRMRNDTIELIVDTINTRYQQEQIHTDRVAVFCRQIGCAMNLSDFEVKALETAGSLHDIGKVIIPQEVLCKPGRLSVDEFNIVKRHSETGYQILRAVDDLAVYAEAVLYHHERWDGEGYPQGLKGEEIPLFSRIIAVADAFEAMTANRVYRKSLSIDVAVHELMLNSGKQFDPRIVEVFVGVLKETGMR